MTCLLSRDVTMVTRPNSDKREYELTILARMIVRAYLGEIDRGEAGPNAYHKMISVLETTPPGPLMILRSYPVIRSPARDTG